MRFATRFTLILAIPFCAFGDEATGIKPRTGSPDYPVHADAGAAAIGVSLLTPEQVRNTFISDLNRSYLVVEVGIYPKGTPGVKVDPDDFVLRVPGTQSISRSARPRVVSGVLQKTAPSSQDVAIYPSVGVGYESGPRVYNPVTGTQRGGGWRTSAGVGVGMGSTRPASTDQDRKTMELELSEKELPERLASKPVAGYLYFPIPNKKRGTAYELEYALEGRRIVLALPTKLSLQCR